MSLPWHCATLELDYILTKNTSPINRSHESPPMLKFLPESRLCGTMVWARDCRICFFFFFFCTCSTLSIGTLLRHVFLSSRTRTVLMCENLHFFDRCTRDYYFNVAEALLFQYAKRSVVLICKRLYFFDSCTRDCFDIAEALWIQNARNSLVLMCESLYCFDIQESLLFDRRTRGSTLLVCKRLCFVNRKSKGLFAEGATWSWWLFIALIKVQHPINHSHKSLPMPWFS